QKKGDLQGRLDKVKEEKKKVDEENKAKEEATKAVETAENEKTQAAYDQAKTKVDGLTDGPDKTKLQERLAEVKKYIEADNAIDALGKKPIAEVTEGDINAAQELINKVKEDWRKNLIDGLNIIRTDKKANDQLTEAKNLVAKAEEDKTKEAYDNAKAKVDALANDQNKTDLSGRLGEVDKYIKADDALRVLEGKAIADVTQRELTEAEELIKTVKDQWQQALKDRLEKLKTNKAKQVAEDELAQAKTEAKQRIESLDKLSQEEKAPFIKRVDDAQNIGDVNKAVLDAQKANAKKKIAEMQNLKDDDRIQADQAVDNAGTKAQIDQAVTDAETKNNSGQGVIPNVLLPNPENPGTVRPGMVRIIFDATADGTIEGHRKKFIDVKEGTQWNDPEVAPKFPVKADYKDNTKVFKEWDSSIPTGGAVQEQEFTAIYKAASGTGTVPTPQDPSTPPAPPTPRPNPSMVDESNKKPVNPNNGEQGTGVIVNDPNNKDVVGRDEDGNNVPTVINPNTGEIVVNPGKNINGPITITVTDKNDPNKKQEITIDISGHNRGRDDNNSDDYNYWHRPYWTYNHTPSTPVKVNTSTSKEQASKTIDRGSKLVIGSKEIVKTTNGVEEKIIMDVAPFIENGRTMLPIRFVAEALGFNVRWDKDSRTVILIDKENVVKIPVDTNKIIVNEKEYTSDVKPVIKNDRTMLPIANIARALGLKDGKDIHWNEGTKEVIITREIVK
ncbi:copper amine oxidase N-terminal domain-containing protein, partial [Peptoniphilus vaginalis]|uniref:copper amine oxidase N-terminal domain-containing protein n=1 Tax=Peptoniphilus vaginalis TaxID=1756987 RepID=UPI0023F9DDD0